jgi:hypothetical protein
VEWRGDLFASDLPAFMKRLDGARAIPYELPHTLTVFLQPRNRDLDVEKTLRLRCYCELPELSPVAVVEAIAREIQGKLQIKERSGKVTELARGAAAWVGEPASPLAERLWTIKLAGIHYRAMSVRVASRGHFEIDLPQDVVRLTVDRQRLLFRLGKDSARFLGDMGPRVEIKAAGQASARAVQQRINPDGLLRRLPYHSLELLFQDELRKLIDAGVMRGYPEIESKFEAGASGFSTLPRRLEKWIAGLPGAGMLLPFPHRIVRVRRYHFCESGPEGEQRVAVETTAGRISAKTKTGAHTAGPVLVRNTRASRTTDIDGSQMSPRDFLDQRAWRAVNRMDKIQTKIPFRTAGGNCYQLSIDDCVDICGRRLRQAELEYIGSPESRPAAGEIYGELEALSGSLPLRPATLSKFDYFAVQAPKIESSTA